MPSLETLKTRPQFLASAATGVRWAVKTLILQEGPAEEGREITRVGYTVTKKVGNSVVRNRLKRRLREAARAVMTDMAKPGRDYVIVGREAGVDRPFEELKGDLAYALRKLNAGARQERREGPRK